ncbi:hypothetical protein GCM10027579_13400 [Calidifontibacter terrae]
MLAALPRDDGGIGALRGDRSVALAGHPSVDGSALALVVDVNAAHPPAVAAVVLVTAWEYGRSGPAGVLHHARMLGSTFAVGAPRCIE